MPEFVKSGTLDFFDYFNRLDAVAGWQCPVGSDGISEADGESCHRNREFRFGTAAAQRCLPFRGSSTRALRRCSGSSTPTCSFSGPLCWWADRWATSCQTGRLLEPDAQAAAAAGDAHTPPQTPVAKAEADAITDALRGVALVSGACAFAGAGLAVATIQPASDVLGVAGRACFRHPYFDLR
ncbi:hypothetical protein OKW26_001205 [Paraburkholderia sp. 32]